MRNIMLGHMLALLVNSEFNWAQNSEKLILTCTDCPTCAKQTTTPNNARICEKGQCNNNANNNKTPRENNANYASEKGANDEKNERTERKRLRERLHERRANHETRRQHRHTHTQRP